MGPTCEMTGEKGLCSLVLGALPAFPTAVAFQGVLPPTEFPGEGPPGMEGRPACPSGARSWPLEARLSCTLTCKRGAEPGPHPASAAVPRRQLPPVVVAVTACLCSRAATGTATRTQSSRGWQPHEAVPQARIARATTIPSAPPPRGFVPSSRNCHCFHTDCLCPRWAEALEGHGHLRQSRVTPRLYLSWPDGDHVELRAPVPPTLPMGRLRR